MSLKRDATSPSTTPSNQTSTTTPNTYSDGEQYLPSDIEWYQRIESSLRFHPNTISPIPCFFVPYDPYSDF